MHAGRVLRLDRFVSAVGHVLGVILLPHGLVVAAAGAVHGLQVLSSVVECSNNVPDFLVLPGGEYVDADDVPDWCILRRGWHVVADDVHQHQVLRNRGTVCCYGRVPSRLLLPRWFVGRLPRDLPVGHLLHSRSIDADDLHRR